MSANLTRGGELQGKTQGLPGMVGEHPLMQQVYELARVAAATDLPVLVTGETGSGKELIARAIHELSARRDGPFVAVNAAAIPDGTFEAEVFGHEKGAFTGAEGARKGYLRQADGGTFFLNEVLELAPHHQPKLLRAIETGNVVPVGSDCEVHADVRTIAAAQTDAWPRQVGGRFRADLWYRLAVLEIALPPLRARASDIPLLVRACLSELITPNSPPGGLPVLSDAAMQLLVDAPWYGNVRELRLVVLRLATLHADRRIGVGAVRAMLAKLRATTVAEDHDEERARLFKLLKQCKGDTVRVAAALRISRSQVYRRLARYQIAPPQRNGRG